MAKKARDPFDEFLPPLDEDIPPSPVSGSDPFDEFLPPVEADPAAPPPSGPVPSGEITADVLRQRGEEARAAGREDLGILGYLGSFLKAGVNLSPAGLAFNVGQAATDEGGFLPALGEEMSDVVLGEALPGLEVLETGARPIRTMIATQSPTQAFRSMFLPSEAATISDLRQELRESLGIPETFGERNEGLEWDAGELAWDSLDFGLDFMIGVGTDPLAWFTGGTKKGADVAKAFVQAQGILRKVPRTAAPEVRAAAMKEAQELFQKATGEILTKERLHNRGFLASAADRLRTGESGVSMGIPFLRRTKKGTPVPVPLPWAAQEFTIASKSLAPIVDSASKLVSAGRKAGYIKGAASAFDFFDGAANIMQETTGVRTIDLLENLQSPTGIQSPEVIAELRRNPLFAAEITERGTLNVDAAVITPVSKAINKVRELGVPEEQLHVLSDMIEAKVPTEHLKRVAEITGRSYDEMQAGFRKRFKAPGAMLDPTAYTPAQRAAMGAAMNELNAGLNKLLAIDQAIRGEEVSMIGEGMLRILGEKKQRLHDVIRSYGINVPETVDDLPSFVKARGLDKIPGDKKALTKALDEYGEAMDNAITVPNYIPLRVTDHNAAKLLVKAERKDPGMMRRMINDGVGSIQTVKEANKAVQKYGTAAFGGRAPKANLGLIEMGRMFSGAVKKGGGLKRVAKQFGVSVEKARRLGKAFEENPALLFAYRADATARRILRSERLHSVGAMLGDDLPADLQKLYKRKEELTNDIRALRESMGMDPAGQGQLPFEEGVAGTLKQKTAKNLGAKRTRYEQREEGLLFGEEGAETTRKAGTSVGNPSYERGRHIQEGLLGDTIVERPSSLKMAGVTPTKKPPVGSLNPNRPTMGAMKQAGPGYDPLGDVPPEARRTITIPKDPAPEGAMARLDDPLPTPGVSQAEDFPMLRQDVTLPKEGTLSRKIMDLEGDLATTQKQIDEFHVGKNSILASKVPGLGAVEGADDFVISSDVAQAVAKADEISKNPMVWTGMAAGLRRFNAFWKMAQLIWPGTTMRNFIGNQFNSALADAVDFQTPADITKLLKLQWAARKSNPNAKADMSSIIFNTPEGRINGYELVTRANEHGAIDSGFFAVEFGDLKKVMQQSGLQKTGQKIGNLFGKGAKGAELGGKATRVKQAIASANQIIENNGKLSHILARMRRGDDFASAALSSSQFLFNYRRVSPAVNWLRKSGMAPFAAWQAKNIPLQLTMSVTKPGTALAWMHAKEAIERGTPEMTEAQKKSYAYDQWGVTISKNPDGSWNFQTLEGLIPFADVVAFGDAFGSIEEFADWATSMIGPVKGGIEALANRNLFTKRDIKRVDKNYERMMGINVDPRTAHMVRAMIGRPMAVPEDLADLIKDRADPANKNRTMVNLLRDHGKLRSAFAPFHPQGKQIGKPTQVMGAVSRLKREIDGRIREMQRAVQDGDQETVDVLKKDIESLTREMQDLTRITKVK